MCLFGLETNKQGHLAFQKNVFFTENKGTQSLKEVFDIEPDIRRMRKEKKAVWAFKSNYSWKIENGNSFFKNDDE